MLVHPSLAGWWLKEGRVPSRVASVSPMLTLRVVKDHPDVGTGSLYTRFVPSTIDCELQQSKLVVD